MGFDETRSATLEYLPDAVLVPRLWVAHIIPMDRRVLQEMQIINFRLVQLIV
jgi:hypothetical protein